MSAETANKELVRHFYEQVWNRGNTDVALEVFADDYVRHDLRPTEAIPGGAGQAKIAAEFRAAFPDLVFTPELIFDYSSFSSHLHFFIFAGVVQW